MTKSEIQSQRVQAKLIQKPKFSHQMDFIC